MNIRVKNPKHEAQKILKELQISRAPVPVEKVARYLGAQLRLSPLDEEISGMIYIKNDSPIIGVNSLHHPNRQRFTIAHECGHLVLHKEILSQKIHVDKQFPILRRDNRSKDGTNPIEIQANQFAAEITMPADLIDRALDRLAKNGIVDIDDATLVKKLAQEFKMSEEAMKIRVGNLFAAL